LAIPTTVVSTIIQIPGLQITAAETANTLRERELNARDKELQLREREVKMRSAGLLADGTRSVYVPVNEQRSAFSEAPGARASTMSRATFMGLCSDQMGMQPAECEGAWIRRNPTWPCHLNIRWERKNVAASGFFGLDRR
jgi:hypothetical protein